MCNCRILSWDLSLNVKRKVVTQHAYISERRISHLLANLCLLAVFFRVLRIDPSPSNTYTKNLICITKSYSRISSCHLLLLFGVDRELMRTCFQMKVDFFFILKIFLRQNGEDGGIFSSGKTKQNSSLIPGATTGLVQYVMTSRRNTFTVYQGSNGCLSPPASKIFSVTRLKSKKE